MYHELWRRAAAAAARLRFVAAKEHHDRFLVYWNNGCNRHWRLQMGFTGECVQHQSIVDAMSTLDIPYKEIHAESLSMPNEKIRSMCDALRHSDKGILLVASLQPLAIGLRTQSCLKNLNVRVMLLDWFGTGPGLAPENIQLLTVSPAGNHDKFLGYALPPVAPSSGNKSATKRYGFLLGKEAQSFADNSTKDILRQVARMHAVESLHCIGCPQLAPNIVRHGVMPRKVFQDLLGAAWFLIGVGDPMASPSILEAIELGVVVILRQFVAPKVIKNHTHRTQYDDLGRLMTEQLALRNYICIYRSTQTLEKCVEFAMSHQRPPITIEAFTKHAFTTRARAIFNFN
jgi:hypothetical protein